MKINNKLQIGTLLVLASVLGFGLLANAQDLSQSFKQQELQNPASVVPQQMININQDGHAIVRGKLVSVTNGILAIKAWGVTITVDVSKANKAGDIVSFAAGDFVGVQGKMDENNLGNIVADTAKDWSATSTQNDINNQDQGLPQGPIHQVPKQNQMRGEPKMNYGSSTVNGVGSKLQNGQNPQPNQQAEQSQQEKTGGFGSKVGSFFKGIFGR